MATHFRQFKKREKTALSWMRSPAPCQDSTQEDLILDENTDSFQRRLCNYSKRKRKQSLIDHIIEEMKESTQADEDQGRRPSPVFIKQILPVSEKMGSHSSSQQSPLFAI